MPEPKEYYCRRCETGGHTWSHRCFCYGLHRVRPLLKAPEDKPNTLLARKLAVIYEKEYGEPFPGGINNAYIRREALSTYRAWRDAGSWQWWLSAKDDPHSHLVQEFGSGLSATECAKIGRVMSDEANFFSKIAGGKE